MVQAVQERSKSSMYGQQPRSLNIHWMKYDVTDENVQPNTQMQQQAPKRLSPLRQRLQQSANEVMNKRQLLTREQIEDRVEEARMRRDIAMVEADISRTEPRMKRSEIQKNRHQYLSQMAR